MIRIATFISLILCSYLVFSNSTSPLYQVDVVLFVHVKPNLKQKEQAPSLILSPEIKHAISLENQVSDAMTPYHLLPTSLSYLRSEYGALRRNAQYKVLCHYSWLQPANNERSIVIPTVLHSDWKIEGTVTVKKRNYYTMNTDLVFTSPDSTFAFTQNQRLKDGAVYYLDHPQAGMLINIHKVG